MTERPHIALNAYRFAALGAASGALYGLVEYGALFQHDVLIRIANALQWIGAGLFYGVIVGAYLRRELDWHPCKWPAFIVAASVAYAAAFYLTIALWDPQSSALGHAAIGALTGGLGALLLDLATAALSQRARHLRFVVPTALIGALLGAPIGQVVEADSVALWMAFLAVWQAAYAGWSAMTLSRSMMDT